MRKFLAIALAISVIALSARAQELEQKPHGLWICDGQHPRCSVKEQSEYGYYQFSGHHIGQFSGVSEVVPDGQNLEQWQTFLTEVISKRPGTNVVSLWADAQSVVDGGRMWGGFLSARSDFGGAHDKDSQLIGLEIDVLNSGKPGVYPNNSKVGLQIVGFGSRLTNAIEVLNEGGAKSESQWQNIFNVELGATASDGTIFGIGPQKAAIGFDLRDSEFKDSAFLLSESQRITFRKNGKQDSAIYRDIFNDGHLVIQAAPSGIRITNASNSENLVIITNDGDIVTKYGNLSKIVSRIEALEKKLAP